jgi:histidyl-tRNA synthetase
MEIVSFGDNSDQIQTNFTIVRGLDYYDGFCVETNLDFKIKNIKGKEVDIGSICSGGRYGKLISRFKGVDFPGTGASIGVDRLVFAMNQLDQVELDNNEPVIICILDNKFLPKYYELLKLLRNNDINSELYLDSSKNLKKQLTYADKRNSPVAVICGETEFKENKITLKKLKKEKSEDDQITISKDNLINEIKKLI